MEGNQPDLQDDAGFRSSDQMRMRSAGLAAPTGMNLRVFKNQANAFYVSIYVLNELLLMEVGRKDLLNGAWQKWYAVIYFTGLIGTTRNAVVARGQK